MTIQAGPLLMALVFYVLSLGLFKRSGYDWAREDWTGHALSTTTAIAFQIFTGFLVYEAFYK